MIAGTHDGNGVDAIGLRLNHAYTILKAVTLSNNQRLLKMRNPWGFETFNGHYNDKSVQMTPEIAAELGHELDKDDGTFYLTIE